MDTLLRRLAGSDNRPFGGKNIIFVGDFRQTCPVIRGGSRAQVVEASLRKSPLWKFLTVHSLNIPVRNAGDPEFSDFVDTVGGGVSDTAHLQFPGLVTTDQEMDLIDFVWPAHVVADPLIALSRAILAPTNAQVDHFNDIVLDRLSGEVHHYYSADSLREAEEEGLQPDNSILDYYTQRTPPGFPPHAMKVKIGAVFRILRNLSVDRGIVKNTRVVISSVGRRLIGVKKLAYVAGTVVLDAEEILLPRISFLHQHEHGHTLLRRQFPLAPAYATTFNSCQGLTLDIVGVDLRQDVFSHGQLYTALTRIRNRHNAMILFNFDQVETRNVVYHELLTDA
jgi:hypothetical protein